MSRWTSWWHALPGPMKFRFYTRMTLQGSLVAMAVALALAARSPWVVAGCVVAGAASVAAIEARAEFATAADAVTRRRLLTAGVAVLVAVWLVHAIVARVATAESIGYPATAVGILVVLLAGFSVVAFVRHRWWITLGLGAVTGAAYASSPLAALIVGAVTFLGGALAIATTVLTVWGLRIVDELERTKLVEAELQVAEERLRFARDLHDVVGRGFSGIAVKSELAVALSRSGDTGRAVTEMDEVRALAVESMGQMRTLVRGYRDIDLAGEVAGARSLLAAVDCKLVVEGDPATVPARFHDVAAWVVREGTTNIVEHSAATVATLALGNAGMSLRNDRPHGDPGERSGLRGVAERLAAVGATLEVAAGPDEFGLEIHWEKA